MSLAPGYLRGLIIIATLPVLLILPADSHAMENPSAKTHANKTIGQKKPKTAFQFPDADINHFIIYGQSLSTGQQTAPAISVTNYAGNLMLGEQVWSNYSNNLDSPDLILILLLQNR